MTNSWTIDPQPARSQRLHRVLLVDDDPVQLKLSRLRLGSEGFIVDTASSADEAMRKAKGIRPDVIMSDVIMRDTDGFTLCRQLRADHALAGIPVVLVSAHYRGQVDRELAERVGAFALVTRTPDFEAEIEAVHQCRCAGTTRPDRIISGTVDEQLSATNNQLVDLAGRTRNVELQYRALFDHATDLIAFLTPDGVIVESNRRSEDLLGIPAQKMVGRTILEFAAGGQEEADRQPLRQAADEQSGRRTVAVKRPDGQVRHVDFSTNVITLDGKQMVLAIGRDVTEQVRTSEALRVAQKMEAIGQLTAGIAHDFNNILAVIIANSDFLLQDLQEADPRRDDADQIRLAAERAAALTRQLLAFSRKQVLEPKIISLNAVVGNLEKMLRRLLGEDIELAIAPGLDLGSVCADIGQIEQVIMNLVVNARDAMPKGGSLTIETANVDLDASCAETHPALEPGRYIMLAVSDTGRGMDEETKRRLFEPFFTTKEKGKGTGLGLSTCYGIVKQSKGSIWVYSEPDRGSVFKVYLPRVDAPPAAARPSKLLTDLRGSETVLMIEDDDRLRGAVHRILRNCGYRVLVAHNGRAALELARNHEGAIDVLLTDVVMPGASGPDVASELQRRFPSVRTLFMSGYTDHAVFRDGKLQAGVNFIQKPFAPPVLAAKLREVLDG